MPIVRNDTHIPPYWLPNGHFQSIYPALFRKIEDVFYERERINTPDEDFLDLDWALNQQKADIVGTPLVILSHGLEGSTSSQYVLGMTRLMTRSGYDCLAWNFRSCSGEMNKASRFYHSGATEDLDLVVQYAIKKGYRSVYLIGFSLGGNLTLKYLGEQGSELPSEIRKALVFSAPMDLKACSMAMIQPRNRVYMHRFLKSLRPKVDEKARLFPDKIDIKSGRFVKTLYDFDHIYTAPIHGFRDADDYYAQCSSMHFVENIGIETLIVNSENDPIVPIASLPSDVIARHDKVFLESPAQGGHCGFRPSVLSGGIYWSEQRALDFLRSA
ncbi:YheT family hydrolase [Dyadobacter helix]|nr:alpha/beta fold hydrolase [Dyadobacter sp. CECT 9275]